MFVSWQCKTSKSVLEIRKQKVLYPVKLSVATTAVSGKLDSKDYVRKDPLIKSAQTVFCNRQVVKVPKDPECPSSCSVYTPPRPFHSVTHEKHKQTSINQ